MNAAGKNGLGALVATANSQLENHLLFAVLAFARGELELERGFVFGLPKIGLKKPMAARLGRPAKAQRAPQEIGCCATGLGSVEIDVGEPIGQAPEPDINVLLLAVEPLPRVGFGDP